MKPFLMILVATFALLGVGPARPAASEIQASATVVAALSQPADVAAGMAPAAVTAAAMAPLPRASALQDDGAADFGASTYVLLAVVLFAMGLVSRRRQSD